MLTTKKHLSYAIAAAVIGLTGSLTACSENAGPPATATSITELVKAKQYPLKPDELQSAQINASSYFAQEWIDADNKRGKLINCRPTDSNKNGKVTCTGKVPQPPHGQTYADVDMYCGYVPEINGCSNKDD